MTNWYEEKQEAKRQRLEARAERLQREGAARIKSGMDRLSAIPFGQPILIGHHSEKRDRNYRSKACGAIDKGMELQKAAGEVAARAASVGTGGISSDDPEAVTKLKEQLAELEVKQERMVKVNKVVRAFWKNGNRAENSDEELARYFEKMTEAGIASKLIARKLLEPDFCGRIGYASYETSNNNANIRRIKARIEQLTRNATRETKEEELPGGIRLVENAEINRVQLFFPGKPSAEVRSQLKASGFRWSPMEGAWQRHLNSSAVYWARDLVKRLTGEAA